ncbi:TIGR03086 family metal-binding protein [Amycolatopsis tucumanensis]|uniref:TIGR03086 family metal-binding protein n=1 Tax=Amycolatopsis tucumanensis TaxID=401106 RepID=A0ABP7IWN9_9PSEU|nr:TIGR03086 family metal-binding protein [Amycolatopsis tucumanensis]MCF6428245.1 TIGR03086 family metal-binding protein [Amycolatopsis tucumanensis]
MTDLRPMLERAAREFTGLLRAIEPAQLDNRTPCAEYDVRGLLNHLLYWGPWLAAALRREPAPAVTTGERDVDLTQGDWLGELCTLVDGLVDTCGRPEALEGTTKFGDAEMPAEMIAGMVLTEWVVHGWDLARATGLPLTVDPEVAAALYASAKATAEQAREMKVFGPEVPCGGEAPVLDRLLALTGRDPEWRA